MADNPTPDELRASIMKAVSCEEFERLHPDGHGKEGYENAASYACKLLLEAAGRDPMTFRMALDKYRDNPFDRELDSLLTEDLMSGTFGLTGFQWGWAVQTAAYLTKQAPVGNPALWTMKR